MKQKNVVILSAVTLVSLGVAALALKDDGSSSAPTGKRALLFPAFHDHINDLAEVRLEKAGKSATLKKEGGEWKLADRGGYPASFEKVKELAVRVADLEIAEKKTAKKENHAKLSLEWPSKAPDASTGSDASSGGSEGGEAALATFKDSSGKELASLVVGKSEWEGSKPKVFVRRQAEDQVYLCAPRGTQALDVTPDAKNWIEAKFVEIANDRVQSVTIEHVDGEKVEIGRSAANHTQFVVENLPEGEKEKYDGVANGVAQALSYIQLEDVRPAPEVDFSKEPIAKTHFRCIDGLELVVETAKFEDKVWVRVSTSYTPPPEEPKAETPAPAEGADAAAKPEGDKPDEPKKEEKKDVGKEAADMGQRLAPWAFQVASYKTDVLARRMKDLVAEPTPAAPADGSADATLDSMGLGADEGQEAPDVAPPKPDAPKDDKVEAPPPPHAGDKKPE